MRIARSLSMADVGKVYPTDMQLLRKELEIQGELLNSERLERKAEVDQLRLELKALKAILERTNPGFQRQFDEHYENERQRFDPEVLKALRAS